jgi:AsmA protein
MAVKVKKVLGKFFKWTGISVLGILLLMFLLPYLFPTFVSNKIKQWANSSIQSELNFSKARLSFFNHFPSLTLTLYDVTLKGSEPFKQETLVNAKEVALGVNLFSLFGKTIKIDEVYFTKGKLNILVDKKGHPNYNVYVPANSTSSSSTQDTSSAALKLERIQVEACELVYNDQSIPMLLTAKQLNYVGKGDLSKAIFDLTSSIQMEGFSLAYGGQQYLENKKLDAKLITQINTSSLALIFEKNDININQLPITFKGKLEFLKDGYSLDFSVNTQTTDFKNLFTALPPAAVTWLDKTNVKGSLTMNAALKGSYIAAKQQAPDAYFNMQIRNGSIAAKTISEPVKNIDLNFHFTLPQLNMEKMAVKIDTIHATLGLDEIAGNIECRGLKNPYLQGSLTGHADLGKWYRTMNIDSSIELKGLLTLAGKFNGFYNPSNKQFPESNVSVQLKDGYIKTGYYPTPITNLQVDADIFNQKGTTKDLHINIKPISLNFEGQPFTISSNLKNFDDLSYRVTSKGVLNIGKLYQLFAIKGYDVKGLIATDISLQGSQADALAGRYQLLHNKGTLKLLYIKFTSPTFPKPFLIKSGNFHFKDDKLMADEIQLNYGRTNATLNGQLSNIINYALHENTPLEGKLTLYTPHLYTNELMAFADKDTIKKKTTKVQQSGSTGVLIIPNNLNLQLNANASSITYNDIELKNFQSTTTLQNGTFNINNASFNLIDAAVKMNASYSSISAAKAKFNYHIEANDVDIQKAYKQIKFFREMVTVAGKAQGVVSLDYTLSGMLNDSMYPIMPTLKGKGVLSVKKAKIYGLKLFSAISKQTGKEKVNNPDISKVDIKTTIANNIMTIERFKLRVAGFRPRFEGQVSLDGKLNLKARLGLPPFGILGIPLSITGTQEKPIVKLRRGRKFDELQETKMDEDADAEDKKEAAEAAAKEAVEKPKANQH